MPAGFTQGIVHGKTLPARHAQAPTYTIRCVPSLALRPTTDARRLILGVCVVAGVSMSVTASFNYILTPMLADLNLTSDQVSTALAIPSIAAILVVFVAGLLGDRLGQRKILRIAVAFFVAGSLAIAVTNGQALLSLGLLLEGVGATVMAITALGLLGSRIDDEGERASAFATYGMVGPIVFMILPVVTGAVVRDHSWRLVPLIWVAAGVVCLVAIMTLLPASKGSGESGELWTPILAGVTVVAAVQFLSHFSDDGLTARTMLTLAGGVVSAVVLVVVYRRMTSPSLSIKPLQNGATALLLIVVLLVPFANTWYYMTLAFQYIFGLGILQTAIAMIPAQLLGLVGAKVVGGGLMRRYGVHQAGTIMLLALAGGMLTLLLVKYDSPLWVPVTSIAVFSLASMGTAVVLTNAVMGTAPKSESGNTAAFRSSASSIGVALGFIVMSSIVFGTIQASMTRNLEGAGLSAEQTTQAIQDLQTSTQNPDYISPYSYPVTGTESLSDLEKSAMADGLHVNGALGAAVALLSTIVFVGYRRRPARSPETVDA